MHENQNPGTWQTDAMIKYFAQYGNVSKLLIDFIRINTQIVHYRKGRHLLSPMDQKPPIYFLAKGVVRGFFKEDGEETTIFINAECTMIGLTLFQHHRHIEIDHIVQAIEPCDLVMIPFNTVTAFFTMFPEMFLISRNLLWEYYHESNQRNFIARLPSAEKRLQRFIQTKPDLYNRISLRYLASYLAMRGETLSRLRNKIAKSDVKTI